MPKEKTDKFKLSKSVLQMKFMKKSKEKAEAEKGAKEGRTMYSENITEGMKNAVEKYVFEESCIPFQSLISGRLSFGGLNPEIEKLMTIAQYKPTPVSREMEKDVSDDEMARYNARLSETLAKKFSRTKKKKKPEFLKPKEDD